MKEIETLAAQTGVPEFFVQVNISGESQKNGCEIADVPAILEKIRSTGIEPRFSGFMGMAAPLGTVGEDAVARQFASLRILRDEQAPGKKLSMGMSEDFEIAIREGSNLVRIGSAIFGSRT